MSDGDGNFPIGSLNQWEIEVLDKEMGRSGFQAWYRNPPHPSGDALAIAYQNAQGHWRRMCPDFLFFHGDSENMKDSHCRPPRPPLRRRASQAARLGRVRRHAWQGLLPHRISRADEGWHPAYPGPHRFVHPRGHHSSRGRRSPLPRWQGQRLLKRSSDSPCTAWARRLRGGLANRLRKTSVTASTSEESAPCN